MSNYNSLKATINANIRTNGNQEITGSVLNSVLNAVVNSLGAGYLFMGRAFPNTNPGTPDQNVCYVTFGGGTYTNFGGIDIPFGRVGLLKYNGSWSYDDICESDYCAYLRAYLSASSIIANNNSLSVVIPVVPGQTIRIVPPSSGSYAGYRAAIVQSYAVGSIVFATGCSLASGTTDTYEKVVPSNGAYLVVVFNAAGTDRKPQSVFVNGVDVLAHTYNKILSLDSRMIEVETDVADLESALPVVTSTPNLLDPNGITEGVILDSNGGGVHDNVDYNTSDWMPVTAGHSYAGNKLIRRINWYNINKGYISQTNSPAAYSAKEAPENAAWARISYAATTTGLRWGDNSQIWDVPYGVESIRIDGERIALYKDIENSGDLAFRGKNLAIVGDSATTPTNWPARLGEALGVARCTLYGVGGYTWRNKYSGGNLTGCIGVLLNNLLNSGIQYDIILFQIGGNDITTDTTLLGNVDDAFNNYNYKAYKDATDTASCVRYYLEMIRRAFPKAMIIVGSVFQRIGSKNGTSAKSINDILRDSCKRLCIQMIDGENDMGFSGFTEPVSPYYNDGNPGVADDRSNLSRNNPAYNYIETASGNIVDYATATDGGALREGYEKRYGLYTYDSKHQNLRGENKCLDFMIASLKKIYKSDNLQTMTT